MATLVLGTVGRALGGPVGGLIGTFVGAGLDRAVLGGRGREVGRLANLAVQSSAYGEPIPKLFGTMRVAGNLVWTAGIAEASATSAGGKGGSGTTAYTYSASFAVLLSGRPVAAVRRVWADGKLLRDAAGEWLTPVTMRLHAGDDGQAPDPLIVAAEGAGGAPAYRGLAYAVFEDLPLAAYGNRIPNLTFEVDADTDGCDAGQVVAGLSGAGSAGVVLAGSFPPLTGFAAVQSGSTRAQLAALTELCDLRFVDDGTNLAVSAGSRGPAVALPADDLGSHDAAGDGARNAARAGAGQLDDAVAIGFHDPSRDYQPGLQRAVRRAGAVRVAQLDIAAALDAGTAKSFAAALLVRRGAALTTTTFSLPVRGLGLRAGAVVRDGALAWSVRRRSFANFVVELAAEGSARGMAVAAAADAGRVHDAGDTPAGPTTLALIDLPGLGDAGATPRFRVAAAGALPGWRRSGVALSLDGGSSYAVAGEIGAASVIGATAGAVPAGCDDRWDRLGRIEVELLGEAMWLEGRSEAAVLAGANLAVVGDELIQFASVAALGARRFALTTLLRGRRGTQVGAHPAGSRFVLVQPDRLLGVDVPGDAVGRMLRLRATGVGDGATPAVDFLFAGRSLQPLAPVFLHCRNDGGDAVFGWVRRSRGGASWADGVDAPLGEAVENYGVELVRGGAVVRRATVTTPAWRYVAADRAADGAAVGAPVTLVVRQLGDLAGMPASADFLLP